MERLYGPIVFLLAIVILGGCSTLAYTNKKLSIETDKYQKTAKASTSIVKDRGDTKRHKRSLVILSLSGGGSRAAYWSTAVMFELEKIFRDESFNLLKEVDVISSVSGGSLPAAYYTITHDLKDTSKNNYSGRVWEEQKVKNLMSKNYTRKWFWSWFIPSNIVKFWFTAFDRSDIMANTFANNLYDSKYLGRDLKFKHMNPERPYLLLNSTNATEDNIGEIFTFTQDEFAKLDSNLDEYSLSRAVMATAAFPAAFNYMTLRNYSSVPSKKKYVHLFDGGNSDNLGLTSVKRVIEKNRKKYDRFIVILVDAYVKARGIDPDTYDARAPLDYVVDFNFLDSLDALLNNVRKKSISSLMSTLENDSELAANKVLFYHVRFNDVGDDKLLKQLNNISTNFKIGKDGRKAIDKAVSMLIVEQNICLRDIKAILQQGHRSTVDDAYCAWNPSKGMVRITKPFSDQPANRISSNKAVGSTHSSLINP